MHIFAHVKNAAAGHEVSVDTDGAAKSLPVPARQGGAGSSVNGGEFLMLALATCFCNDLYREAARLGIAVDGVEVQASAEFEGPGLSATNVRYSARIDSPASQEEIERLLTETDAVAEVHNTLRSGRRVERVTWPPAR